MRRSDLAKRLINAATARERRALLAANNRLADVRLAEEIRDVCYAVWTVEPAEARRAATALKSLSTINDAKEIRAFSFWVDGVASITRGKFESAIASFGQAEAILKGIDAAQVRVAKLLALAMLGRYDEAVRTAKKALRVFVAARDRLAAGKIEMNLSNIAARQAKHHEAEKYGLAARQNFIKSGEKSWQAMSENGLANTYTELLEFEKAAEFYRLALETARAEKMPVTEAEIEASLGNLATLRSEYGEAVKLLERSRQRYDELNMPHQSAIAELEIADIYLHLNLLDEAVIIYGRVSSAFHALKLRFEEARSRLNHGRAATRLGDFRTAKAELRKAASLFAKEENVAGQISALVAQAEAELASGHAGRAMKILADAPRSLRRRANPIHDIWVDLLRGQALCRLGKRADSAKRLTNAFERSKKFGQESSAAAALNLLGENALVSGKRKEARSYFKKAVTRVERLRSAVTTEEFSMAFFASQLAPFENLTGMLLAEGEIAEAFDITERGRARALLDAFDVSNTVSAIPTKLRERLSEIRAELNFQYKKLDRAAEHDEELAADIRAVEWKLAAVTRQINSLSDRIIKQTGGQWNLATLRKQLGGSATLVEFVEHDGLISAFVVTHDRIEFVRGLGTMGEVRDLLEQLHFQFGSLRYSGEQMSRFAGQLKSRADQVLRRLYDLIFLQLRPHILGSKIVVVPSGVLNYVPFAALHDGEKYLIESFEISYAPSAAVWAKLAVKRDAKMKSSLLMGYADERIPLVENEIRTLEKIAPRPKSLIGGDATFSAFIENAGRHDLIHLACHGQFRPDNPMFSSLHLADGWVTVQDACSQRLRANLVTLSACETGINKVFAGDEILGLARGFLSAGAASLVVSLWTVNDKVASVLMEDLYKNLQRGKSVSASLRDSQLGFIDRGAHPYYWSPFIHIGR